MLACSRDADAPALRGTLTSEPELLLAEPSGRPDAVVHGRLFVRADADLPAGSVVRILQGYHEDGRWLGAGELRYALAPVPSFGGRAYGVGARSVDRATGSPIEILAVAALPPQQGWLGLRLDRPLPATAEIELLLGDPTQPGVGPPTNPLPIEVELAAELLLPAAPDAPIRLDGRVFVRVAPARADWLRVIAPAQARAGEATPLTLVFMSGWSGPQRSSLDARLPAGELELRGPFPLLTVAVAAEPPSDAPQSLRVELPPLPAGVHRIEARFRGEPELRGLSNPIRATPAGDAPAPPIFFGSIHGHTALGGHATGTPSRALRYAREVSALDFVALSEHREAPAFDGAWLALLAGRESRPRRFVVFTAWEWTDARSGHRHVLARTPVAPPPAPPDLLRFSASVGRDPDVLVVGHHSLWNGGSVQRNFDWGEPGLLPRQRLAEVYSWHGCSLTHDSAFPMHGNHDQELDPALRTDVLSALARGHRLFLVADGDNHLGKPGSLVGIEWPRGRRYAYQGLVAVRAAELERETLFRAMEAGAVYGTTGARILLDAERRLRAATVAIAATAPLARVALRSPERRLAERTFDPVPPDAGDAAAPLYLDPARGTWDAVVELGLPETPAEDPWIVEVAQQDHHHAWLLLPPESWSR